MTADSIFLSSIKPNTKNSKQISDEAFEEVLTSIKANLKILTINLIVLYS